MDVALPLIAFALLTAGNAFFVIAEYSLVTVDRATLQKQAQQGDRAARSVLVALRTLSFQLSGAQLGITVTALLTGYLAEPAISELVRPALEGMGLSDSVSRAVAIGIGMLIATVISMLFGELVPKNAALARSESLVRVVAGPQRAFSRSLQPLIAVLNGSANWLVRRMGIEPQDELASARTPEELSLLAARSAREGALAPETATLLQRTIRFSDKRAGEAMTPRRDVIGVRGDAMLTEVLKLAQTTGHSTFPVYAETLDDITGIVGVHDVIGVAAEHRDSTRVRAVAQPPVSIPESVLLDDVLERLRVTDAEIVVVVDEYGGTDGIISAEDLVEELVGEIADEYDAEETTTDAARIVASQADLTREVQGILRADELFEQTGFRLPDGPFETLAGFVMARLGHIPETGERVTEDGWTFEVTEVDRHRVVQVRVVPRDESE